MTIITKTFTLNDGKKIPALGLGTASDANVEEVTYAAIKDGYRHIDTAYIYKSEKAIGNAIKKAIADGLVSREELFVTTKVWPTFHGRVKESLDYSLGDLGLDYVDLLLVHWPAALHPDENDRHAYVPKNADGSAKYTDDNDWIQIFIDLEKEKNAGRVKSIGVSNASEKYLKELFKRTKIVPAVNQFENHPYLPQKKEIEFNEKHGILVTAYSPLGSSSGKIKLHENPVVVEIAKKHNATTGSVLINWHIAQGRSVIPKTRSVERVKANAELVELDKDDLAKLDAIWEQTGTQRAIGLDWLDKAGDNLGFADK
ncbi:D-arabinose dehydrogenase [NAD(P)+] heavy chain [Yarrowia sp. B02]|nr:D-arabinose dehydrogenase [NAD(P)+] heavy chain [Yarrowia sp. B02]